MFARYPHPVPEKEKMVTFINSLNSEMSYHLNLHCPSSFEKMIKDALTIESALVKKGIIKHDKENPSSSNHHN